MKKISLYIVAIVVIGAVSSGYWGYQKYFKAVNGESLYFHVERGGIREVVKVRGEVTAEKEFDLEFPFSETVEEIYVDEGQSVKKDDRLMLLNVRDFELEVSEVRGQLAQAGASIKSAQAQVSQYEAEVDSAKEVLKQYEAALEGQVKKLVDIELGAREPQIKVGETAVENAQRIMVDAGKDLENVESKVARDDESLIRTSRESKALFFVTLDAVFTEKLEDVIYPARIPAARTCKSQILAAPAMVSLHDSCLNMLNAYESLKLDIKDNDSDDREVVAQQLNEQKQFLSTLRFFLGQLLNGLATDVDPYHRGLVTGSQAGIESLSSSVISQIEAFKTQELANKTAIDLAQAKINAAENALRSAQDELALLKAGPTPEQVAAQQAEVERARAQVEAQKSQIKKAEALVKSQQAQVSNAQANAAVIQSRIGRIQEKIKKSTIYAPVDAQVVKIYLEEQEVFRPGSPAVSLSSSTYKILADVSELDIGRVRQAGGNDVLIHLDAFEGEEFVGKVLFLDPQEVTKDGDRFYRVNASLVGNNNGIRAGMSADLFIVISSKENVLKIPEIAVVREDEREYVVVKDGEVKREVDLKSGISDGDYIEVIDGLKEGQILVVGAD